MYDLSIIGGGPGGYVAAIRAAQLGMKTAVFEMDSLGGTCLNRGCIPTKAYFQNAQVMHTLDRLSQYNVTVENRTFDMAGARERKDKIVNNLVTGIAGVLKANGVEVIKSQARVSGVGLIQVGNDTYESSRILIASGSLPLRLSLPGFDDPRVVTSDEMLEIDHVPEQLVIIGGGVIGIEFACIFNALGSNVTVIEYQPDILNLLDQEIVKRMTVYLKKQKITLHTGTSVQSIESLPDELRVIATGKKGEILAGADLVLVAAGRRPNSSGLGLDELGVETDHGFIKVDSNYETNVRGIFAIGDVIGQPMLAHAASEEGIVAVERMQGIEAEVPYHAIPSCVFSIPEAATVGKSEEEARNLGIPYKTGKFLFAASGKAMAMGETDGLVKAIADANGVIIGVHIAGPHASDLIQEASLIVRHRLTIEQVAATVHPHPTLGEALLEAVLDADGRALHINPKK
ncbi:MAG: dihydrolipoyl dehydrogenase [Methylocystaceae bacterium]